MTFDWLSELGAFLFEHSEMVLIIGLIFLAVGLLVQMAINSLLEEDLIEVCERLEQLENAVGIAMDEDADDCADGRKLEEE